MGPDDWVCIYRLQCWCDTSIANTSVLLPDSLEPLGLLKLLLGEWYFLFQSFPKAREYPLAGPSIIDWRPLETTGSACSDGMWTQTKRIVQIKFSSHQHWSMKHKTLDFDLIQFETHRALSSPYMPSLSVSSLTGRLQWAKQPRRTWRKSKLEQAKFSWILSLFNSIYPSPNTQREQFVFSILFYENSKWSKQCGGGGWWFMLWD